MSEQKPCVFCDIITGKSPGTVIVFSNENIIIFEDIRPASEHHYLAVPKKHLHNVRSLNADHKDLSEYFFLRGERKEWFIIKIPIFFR